MPTTPPALSAIPAFPALSERAAGTYNASAYSCLNTWAGSTGPQLSALAENVYDNALEAGAAAVDAEAASAGALAAANYKGAWSSLTGALAIPASVSHSGAVYALVSSVADVTAHTPGASAQWIQVSASSASVGDIVLTSRALTSPAYLPCDGSAYLQSSYTALYAELGLLITPGYAKWANPGTLPVGYARGVEWDSAGAYLAVAHGTTPFVTVYSRSGSTLTKLTNPATLPTGAGCDVAWDSAATYLAVAHEVSPYITVYERSGSTLTKLTNPGTLPTGNAEGGVSVTPDGVYFAVAHTSSPYITVYSRSGSTLTKLADPATLPTGTPTGVSWDSTGTYLAVAHNTSPYITVYSRSGSTLTKLANPASLPADAGNSCAWSPGGEFLAVGSAGTAPYLQIYQRSGSTLIRLPSPSSLPAASGMGCAWDSTGTYLAVSQGATSPYVVVYERRGTEFIRQPDLASPSANTHYRLSWGPNGAATAGLLAAGINASPYVVVYDNLSYDPATQFATPKTLNPAPTGTSAYIKATA